jgi:hypothetical protein
MIQIEIIQGPDQNTISPVKYFQNQIFIGRSSGDLQIDDPELNKLHLMLEVIGQDLILHPQKGVEFYLLNGKRSSVVRKIKTTDSITVGKTTFKVVSFEETIREKKKDILNRKLNQLIEDNSLRMPVIENLSKLMK